MTIYVFDEFSMDKRTYTLRRDGEDYRLTPTLFELLITFLESNGQVLTQEILLKKSFMALVKTGVAAFVLFLLVPLEGRAKVVEYTLTASQIEWEIAPGRKVAAYAYNGTVPGPILRAEEGDTFKITLVNNLGTGTNLSTTLHPHGVPVPNRMDGVPGVTQDPILPGGSFTYEFAAPSAGTYVYHSHFDTPTQLPKGLFGMIVVDAPAARKLFASWYRQWDREIPMIFSEAVDKDGNHAELINGKAWTVTSLLYTVKKGERILFRMFNASSEVHPMHSHGLHWIIIATDGHDLWIPYPKDTLPVNAGERYDGVLVADTPGTWLIHCHDLSHVAHGMIAALVVE